MALAAQSVAVAAGWKMFYVDLDTDEVIWLGDNAAPRQRLGLQLRLAHYLRAYGFNRLFVIECKTARLDSGVYPKANDTLFKLAEVCRRVGGLGTRAMLASYRPVRDSERKLAKALGIELVCGSELIRLRERIGSWVTPAAGP